MENFIFCAVSCVLRNSQKTKEQEQDSFQRTRGKQIVESLENHNSFEQDTSIERYFVLKI